MPSAKSASVRLFLTKYVHSVLFKSKREKGDRGGQIKQELVEQHNDDFFLNPLPFLKETMGRNSTRCQRLVSAVLLKSTGIRNIAPFYLNLAFQIK